MKKQRKRKEVTQKVVPVREFNMYADKASATSATGRQKQQRPKSSASATGSNTQSTLSSNSKQSAHGGSAKQGAPRTVTPIANQTP